MPKMALADTLAEGDSLLRALDENEALNVPHLRELRDQLAAVIGAIKELAAEQAELEGRRRAVTQQLRITKRKEQDLVIKVRAMIRAQLGHRNEGLVRYRIRPIRRRSRAVDEEIGIVTFARPDLLAAAGLAPQPSPAAAEPGPAPAASSAGSAEETGTPAAGD